MGKQIVREESLKNPGQRSRLFNPKEVCDVLKNNRGTEIVETIFLDANEYRKINLGPKAFENMVNLSHVQKLWNGILNLPNLETLDLSNSKMLVECPNVAGSPNLKRVTLDNCESLSEAVWDMVRNNSSKKEIKARHLWNFNRPRIRCNIRLEFWCITVKSMIKTTCIQRNTDQDAL
ncbi:non-specific serine/threonine protein kinase [Trifolium repens]|nr:non-specific serine/threonine protein kinase [Trifolium repens]